LPRRFRIACFCIVTPFQIGIILTGNYAFLNYIVLALGFLLLDDRFVEWMIPDRIREWIDRPAKRSAAEAVSTDAPQAANRGVTSKPFAAVGMAISAVCFLWIFYATSAKLLWMFEPNAPLPQAPVQWLEPFRVANQYGLFAVMTHARYEIEFQGSQDGQNWTPYPFRYKPQNPAAAPGIYAPYQPRFEWNLWFASLGSWPQYRFVVWTEERLLMNDRDVLQLFAKNPFGADRPKEVRAVIYQYWFTSMKTKRETGMWWTREQLGLYAPELERQPDGKIVLLDSQTVTPPAP
jgi:lipase maturation factor 1